jgi:hypothetical protein
MGGEVQSLFTLVQAGGAHESPLAVRSDCVAEPPEDLLSAARARARLRYAKILRLAGQEVATQNKATLEQVLDSGKQP